MTNLRIHLLGGFSLTSDGKRLLSGRHTSRMALLVAFLALTHGRRRSRKQLASTFWPDSTDLQARNNLRSLLTLLRRQAPELTPYLQAVSYTPLDVYKRQPLADLVIVRVVAGRHLERAGAEFAIHVRVGDHRNLAVEHRHACLLYTSRCV